MRNPNVITRTNPYLNMATKYVPIVRRNTRHSKPGETRIQILRDSDRVVEVNRLDRRNRKSILVAASESQS